MSVRARARRRARSAPPAGGRRMNDVVRRRARRAPGRRRDAPQSAAPRHVFLIDGVGVHLPRLFRAGARHQGRAVPAQIRRHADRGRDDLQQHAGQVSARDRRRPRRGDLRRLRPQLPQRALRPVQGEPPRDARRSRAAMRACAAGRRRVRRLPDRDGQFRGRRSDRDLCAARGRGRRQGDDPVLRQGPDAAGRTTARS